MPPSKAIAASDRRWTRVAPGLGYNQPNFYNLSGLVAAAKKQAEDASKVKSAREKEDSPKQSTPKTFDLINGGKT